MAIFFRNTARQGIRPLVDHTRLNSSPALLKGFFAKLSQSVSASSLKTSKEDDDSVTITDSCVRKMKKIGSDNILRVSVEGGGCSGFQTKFDLVDSTSDEDKMFEKDGVKVVIDVDSLELLKGSTIDYVEELIRSSFAVTKNPQAEQGCSCGVSFSIKDL